MFEETNIRSGNVNIRNTKVYVNLYSDVLLHVATAISPKGVKKEGHSRVCHLVSGALWQPDVDTSSY